MGKVRTRRSTEAWLRQAALLRRVHELIGNFDAEMDIAPIHHLCGGCNEQFTAWMDGWPNAPCLT